MSPADLRDNDLELRLVQHVLRAGPRGLGCFDETGIAANSFANPVYRKVFRVASAVAADGRPVDALSVSLAAGGDPDLSLACLSRLEGSVAPMLDEANLRKAGDRLNALERSRRAAALLETALSRIGESPDAIDTITEHLADTLQQGPDAGLAEWPDDVAIGRAAKAGAYLIDGIVPHNGLTTLYGPPGSAKTFVALALACATACNGSAWLGLPVRRHGPVLYLAAEGQSHLGARVGAWKLAHGLDVAEVLGVRFETSAPALDDDQALARLIPRVRRLRPVLIVVDTLARHFSGLSENDSACMGAFVRGCDRLREASAGAAVVVLHHPGKDPTAGERGSGALRGAMDSMFEVSKADGTITLTFSKGKDAAEWAPVDAVLRPFGDSVVALGAQHEPNRLLAPAAAMVLRKLVEVFGVGGADGGELRDVLKAGVTTPTFYRARTALLEHGLIEIRQRQIKPTIAGLAEARRLASDSENPPRSSSEILTGGNAA
ncbi:AAA family ATPase [Luteitalea sp.]